jgi:hypothetical protein
MSGLTGSGFGFSVDTDERIAPTNNGDHDKFSHYVHKDDAMRSLVYGEHIMALCGKVWVIEQEGDRFPVCPECKEIFNSIPSGGSDE